MTVQELLELLEDCDPEAEIRIAQSPDGWPLAFETFGVAAPDEAAEGLDDGVVWLVSGDHPEDSPYAPSDLRHIARVA